MPPFLRRLAETIARTTLRIVPWVVTAAAISLGTWLFATYTQIASHSTLAAISISTVMARTAIAIAALSAGSFALSSGLASLWFDQDGRRASRFRGLSALGAASALAGGLVIGGPLIGISVAHSMGFVAMTAVLAAMSARSAWVFRSGKSAPRELSAPNPVEEWVERQVSRDRSRERTPVT